MDTIILSIDSEFRNKELYPNYSQFTYNFQNDLVNISQISLSSIEFPNTYYTFTDTRDNNYFMITTNENEVLKLSLVDGSYTSDLLLNYLQNAFNQFLVNGMTTQKFTIEFNEITSKITISSNVHFTLDFTNLTNYPSLGYHLGFTEQKIYSEQLSYTGDTILNTIGEQYIYLLINNWGELKASNITDTCIFAKILLTQQKTFIIYDDRSNFITKEHNFKIPQRISSLNISLIDKYGNLLEMNQDFSLTLEFKKVYDSNFINN
jgi:hypothetical protein